MNTKQTNEKKLYCNGCGYPIIHEEQANWHEEEELVLCDKCESEVDE